DSEHDANMLYAVRMFVPDPFIYLRLHGKCHMVMNDLEIDRARKEATHCRVLSLTQYHKRMEQESGKKPDTAKAIRFLLRSVRLKKVLVPHNFPLGLARDLQKLKIKLKVRPRSFFPEREVKNT